MAENDGRIFKVSFVLRLSSLFVSSIRDSFHGKHVPYLAVVSFFVTFFAYHFADP